MGTTIAGLWSALRGSERYLWGNHWLSGVGNTTQTDAATTPAPKKIHCSPQGQTRSPQGYTSPDKVIQASPKKSLTSLVNKVSYLPPVRANPTAQEAFPRDEKQLRPTHSAATPVKP